ncbi:MAG: hypothetical protein FWE67_07275 [Planctomycetaceae bacterium]|nr:hypothetical protein [Planctomycetaceae bacterium]
MTQCKIGKCILRNGTEYWFIYREFRVWFGYVVVREYFCEYINARGRWGKTPQYATLYHSEETVKKIIEEINKIEGSKPDRYIY